jgi:hypothetical protein
MANPGRGGAWHGMFSLRDGFGLGLSACCDDGYRFGLCLSEPKPPIACTMSVMWSAVYLSL